MLIAKRGVGALSGVLLGAAISLALLVTGAAWIGRRWSASRAARAEAKASLQEVARGKLEAAGLAPREAAGDDLKMIEGIGPRVEGVLHAAGIDSFEQLASLRPGRIETILREAGGRMANPGSWPRQAALAATGRWDELRRLQARLDRGTARA